MEIFESKHKEKKNELSFQLHTLHSTRENFDDTELLSKYNVGPSAVSIVKNRYGKAMYFIDEPVMSEEESLLYSKIMKQMYLTAQPLKDLTNDKAHYNLKKQILTLTKSYGISNSTRPIIDKLMYYVMRDTIEYGIISTLMNDSDIEDILSENYNFPVGIIHRKFQEFGVIDTNIHFSNATAMNSFVQRLVQRCEKTITAAVPFIDAITDEGHRVSATFGREISLPGPNFSIRKFSSDPYTIINLIKFNTLSPLMAAYLWLLIDVKGLILVVGPTASGKTTTLASLLAMIDPRLKITTIEDTPEIRLPHEHWQRLITRKSYSIVETKYDVDMGHLIKLALRSRPDYIVVGEVRGDEALYLTQAAATGHGGLTSFHATDAQSALVRLGSPPLNVELAGQMLIWGIVRQNRVNISGKSERRVTHITEIIPTKNSIELRDIFTWNPNSDKHEPQNVDDLIKKSYRLKEIMKLKGSSENELKNDLLKRYTFLTNLISEGKTKYSDVANELSKFDFEASS